MVPCPFRAPRLTTRQTTAPRQNTHADAHIQQQTTPQHARNTTPGFGRHYFAQNPGAFASDDAAYVLAYAVIMLNTDLHNSQVTE